MPSSILLSIIVGALALLGALSIVYLSVVYLWEDRLHLQLPELEVGSEAFLQAHHALTGSLLQEGNAVEVLRDGPQIFPRLFDAIRAARQTVHLESYILRAGTVAAQLADELGRAAARGADVRVILDAIGSVAEVHPLVSQLRAAGVRVAFFHPVRWFTPQKLNQRTHRKLLLVDGERGFIGGIGYSDEWIGSGGLPPWRETQLAVTGPCVREMQAAFLDHWIALTGEIPTGGGIFPTLPLAGDALVQVVASSPKAGSTTIRLLYSLAVASAQQTIDIASAYLIPDRSALRAFARAVQRGVRVRVLIPGPHHDVPIAGTVTRHLVGSLLRRGVEVYEYQPTMMHAKVLVVDGQWSIVGSANFDNRSFMLNDELNLAVLDRGLGEALSADFEADLRAAKPVTYEAWRARPWQQRREEFWAMLLRQQF